MAEQQKSPFVRVSNGYDPKQVAAFAAEALGWKRENTTLRTELASAIELIERYESVIGSIESVEREAAETIEAAQRKAAELVENAENEAAQILEMAENMVGESSSPADPPQQGVDLWLTPDTDHPETPDPVEEIFDPVEEVESIDPEADREQRVAAAAANLWKRRGVLAPPE